MLNYSYNFHNFFSLTTNIDYFDGLLHSFKSTGIADTNTTFRFVLDNKLKISLLNKPVFNMMLGYDAQTDSVDFAYPWIRPVCARLTFGKDGFQFTFNKNYLRFSRIVAEGWEVIDVFRSLLMVSLIKSGMYMAHSAAVKLGDEGILIPSFANTGKTTTAWMLCKQGAQFLTDELAVLDSRGNCLSFPCSSLLTSGLAKSLGLNLTRTQKLSMQIGRLKSKLFSVRFIAGGLRLYPEDFFEVCDSVKIRKVAFIQNGVDDFRRLSVDEAIGRLMAIRNFELGWNSNPYLIAESFFNPSFDLEELLKTERAFVSSFLLGLEEIYLVSSSNGSHYKTLEDRKQEISLKPVPRSS
jgi:hypothetical protein